MKLRTVWAWGLPLSVPEHSRVVFPEGLDAALVRVPDGEVYILPRDPSRGAQSVGPPLAQRLVSDYFSSPVRPASWPS